MIYNGVDLARFSDQGGEAFREKYGLPAGKLVTFIGTFATQYDFDTMFAVAERLQDRKEINFVFIGAGSQAAQIQQFNLPNVHLIEWVPFEEIPQAWAASYLTYWAMRDHPLYQGTIPAKVYEALASGVPVVAAMAGEGAKMIQISDAGVIVPCGDVEGLTGAITRIIDDQALRTVYGRSGRNYAEQYFEPEQVAAAYEAVLLKAANG